MLSIIIVNYYSLQDIEVCLSSMQKFHLALDYEIIVVNNGDKEQNVKRFMSQNGNLIWVDMGYNAGFARANNKGISLAKNDYILLLNPDTIFIEPILLQCISVFKNQKDISALGVQLLHKDLSFQISGSYFMKGGINHILPLPIIGPVLKALGTLLNVKKPHLDKANYFSEVDWVSGAFLLTHKNIILKSGMMCEDFFLYAEEVEWCSRLKKQGALYINAQLKIIHAIGGTSSKEYENEYYDLYSRKGLQLMVSNHLRVRKQYGVFWLLFLFLTFLCSAIFSIPFALIKMIITCKVNPLRQAFNFLKNTIALSFLLPRMIWNKPYFYKVLP